MKKIAIVMSMVFCLAAFANAQKPWSATPVPGKAKMTHCHKAKNGVMICHKHFKKGGFHGHPGVRQAR